MNRATAALWLFVVFSAAALAAEPPPPGPAEPPPDPAILEAEVVQLRAEVNLLRRENARLQKEAESLRAGPVDATAGAGSSDAPAQPGAFAPPPKKTAAPAGKNYTLSEFDPVWLKDVEALGKHVHLREAFAKSDNDARLAVWLKRQDFLVGRAVEWSFQRSACTLESFSPDRCLEIATYQYPPGSPRHAPFQAAAESFGARRFVGCVAGVRVEVLLPVNVLKGFLSSPRDGKVLVKGRVLTSGAGMGTLNIEVEGNVLLQNQAAIEPAPAVNK